jgi:glycosyltransferase involved in cell wall biosynthesis
LEKNLFKKTNKITAVAASVASELEPYGIDPNEVQVLGNGVNTDLFKPDAERKQFKTRYFLTAGRLGPRKGLEDLLASAQIILQDFPDIEFWIAGSGPYENQLRALTKSLGIKKNIQFLGHVSDRNKMAQLYREAIAYIHPAHYEGLPTVLLEAMACGKPVIATAVSGALDVIENNINGLLCPIKNPGELAKRISYILGHPHIGQTLGQNALDTIRQRYSWDIIGRNYLALYQDILNRRSN